MRESRALCLWCAVEDMNGRLGWARARAKHLASREDGAALLGAEHVFGAGVLDARNPVVAGLRGVDPAEVAAVPPVRRGDDLKGEVLARDLAAGKGLVELLSSGEQGGHRGDGEVAARSGRRQIVSRSGRLRPKSVLFKRQV